MLSVIGLQIGRGFLCGDFARGIVGDLGGAWV